MNIELYKKENTLPYWHRKFVPILLLLNVEITKLHPKAMRLQPNNSMVLL